MAKFVLPYFGPAPDPFVAESSDIYIRWVRNDWWWLLRDHEVVFSGLGQDWLGWRSNGKVTVRAGYKVQPRKGRLNLALAWLTQFRDVRWSIQYGPCITIAPTPFYGFGVALAKRRYGQKVILIQRLIGHDASRAQLEFRSWWWSFSHLNVQQFVLWHADLVLPVGKFTTELALALGASPEKMVLLPYPVGWPHEARRTPVPDSPTILFVGRLEPGKGIHILLKAMVQIRQQLPQAHLSVVGAGLHRQGFEQIMKSLGLQENVSFLGWVSDQELVRLYQQARVCVMPSIWQEGQGTVLLEAGLMGRPVVASNLGGITDIIHHNENGLLIPPNDELALAEAIVAVLQDRDLAHRMGEAGFRIVKNYSAVRATAEEHVQHAITELLRRCAPQQGKAPLRTPLLGGQPS